VADAVRIDAALRQAVDDYPQSLRQAQLDDIDRQKFHLAAASDLAHEGRLVDLGAGVGIFSVGCALLGMDVTIVDDFDDPVNARFGDDPLVAHRKHGVKVVERNVIADGLAWEAASVDTVTCFESMEHWHSSPKRLFAEVVEALRPGGWFFMGVPNAVNLRKRIEVPMGRASCRRCQTGTSGRSSEVTSASRWSGTCTTSPATWGLSTFRWLEGTGRYFDSGVHHLGGGVR